MSQTVAGAIKQKATMRKKYGKGFYKQIGAEGGRNGHYGGFNAMSKERLSEVGRSGAAAANRKGVKIPPHVCVEKGKYKWYYNIVAHNGKILSTSQHYWSKKNCIRAAKATATALGGTIIIRESK